MPENLSPIYKRDLIEADFLRNVMANDPNSKGNYEVIPGSNITTVKIFRPSKPHDEAALRESMKKIKSTLRSAFGHEPNMLRFEFKEVTIEE